MCYSQFRTKHVPLCEPTVQKIHRNFSGNASVIDIKDNASFPFRLRQLNGHMNSTDVLQLWIGGSKLWWFIVVYGSVVYHSANKGLQFCSCLDIIYQSVPYRSFAPVYRIQSVVLRNNLATSFYRSTTRHKKILYLVFFGSWRRNKGLQVKTEFSFPYACHKNVRGKRNVTPRTRLKRGQCKTMMKYWLNWEEYNMVEDFTRTCRVRAEQYGTQVNTHPLKTYCIQGDSLARGSKILSIKLCYCYWNATIISIDYEQVLFCIVPGMCI